MFKILEESEVVIHDLKLVGDSSVAHQIDVSIENAGRRRRVIIECKDFDLSGQKVGLDILRNFRSVMEDTKAEEGIVLTCTGYTQNAQKYAKAKGIKLAVLREIRAEDFEGTIQTVVVKVYVQSQRNHATELRMSQESHDYMQRSVRNSELVAGFIAPIQFSSCADQTECDSQILFQRK